MPANIAPAARLLNLVIALMNTPLRMTKEDIRGSVAGYDEASSPEAFERMFERDKDALRDMGVPIVIVDPTGHAQEVGYRIDKDAYALEEVDLTPAELGVLSLAAQFWQDSAVAVDTSRAVTKLRSAGEVAEGTDAVAGLAPRVRSAATAYETLLDAVVARRVVSFTYRAANTGQVRRRSVEPWRVVVRRGGWYLLGYDQDREAPRAFKLTRVEGAVRAMGPEGAFDIPDVLDGEALVGRRGTSALEQAVLALLPERASALRAQGTTVDDGPRLHGRDLVQVEYTSGHAMADEIAGYGDAVLVLSPADLREQVVARLTAAAGLTGPADGTLEGGDRG